MTQQAEELASTIPGSEAQTIAEHPVRRGSSHGQGGSLVAVKALNAEEATHARAFALVVVVLVVLAMLCQPFLPRGHRGVHLAFIIAIAALGGMSLYVMIVARQEQRFTTRLFRVYAGVCIVAAGILVYYGGVGSSAAVALAFGINFFGRGRDRTGAAVACVIVSASYMLLAALVVFGVIPDLGLFPSDGVPFVARLFLVIMVPSVCLATFWQARISRNATVEAIERLDAAMRLAQQRQAQLDEAHQNLDAALRGGAGRGGRYTGATIGRWAMGDVIGRGAMGDVYEARDVDSGEPAAVKLMQKSPEEDPDLLRRFLREADITAGLRSPHVVRVFEAGTIPDGTPYIAMERLHGEDLARQLRKKAMGWGEATRLVTEVGRGLDTAHAAGIVHRDIKPQNLFLADVWKILDFGVSKLRGSAGTLTHGAVIGTPGYMSPEQAQARDADARADIFALAAVAYRALCGRPPFVGPDTPQILYAIVYATPARPTELVPGLPRHVDAVLLKGLAKDPADRFASAGELAAALAGG